MTLRRVLTVLRATRRLPPLLGGQEVHVGELSRALRDLGVRQEVVFSEGEPLEGVDGTRVELPFSNPTIPADAIFGLKVARHASRRRQDVVHTHGDAPVARGGSMAASRSGAVHVHTFHAGLMEDRLRGTVLTAFLPKQSHYLAVSEAIARQLAGAGIARERIWVRPSGVRAAFLRAGLDRREPVVVIGGRVGSLRRVAEFVGLWARRPPEGVTLAVVGTGPDEDQVRRVADATPSIRWLGQLDQDQLAELLRAAATGLVLSKSGLSEGTPTLALEMLASGCAPLVSEATGLAPRLVRDLGFGAVFDDMPRADVVAELTRRYQGPVHRPLRERARALIAETHAWPAVARSVAQLYRRLQKA